MILACNLHLLKVDPRIKGSLRMLPWGKHSMHANQFFSVPEGTNQLNCTSKRLLNCWERMCISGRELIWLPSRFVQFLGKADDFYQDCAIPRLSSPAGRFCAIFLMKLDWKNCTILEPIKLPDKIVQFLVGRLVSLQNCAIS